MIRARMSGMGRGMPRVGPTSYDRVEDEGILLPQQPILNFTGGGVTATNNVPLNRTDVTIPLGAGINMPANPGDNLKIAYAWAGNFLYTADLRTNGTYLEWVPGALVPLIRQQDSTVAGGAAPVTGPAMVLHAQDVLQNNAGFLNTGASLACRAGNALNAGGGGTSVGGAASWSSGTGTTAAGLVTINAGATPILSANVTAADFLRLGLNAAAAGYIRLPNTGPINWRNFANGADVGGINVNASDQLVPIATATQNGFESAAAFVRIWGTAWAAVSVAIGAGYVDIGTTAALLTAKNTSLYVEFDVTNNRALASHITRFGSLKCGVAWLDDDTLTIESLDNNTVASGAAPAVTGAFGSGVGWRLTFNAGHTVTLAIQQDAAIARSVNARYWFAATDTQVAP